MWTELGNPILAAAENRCGVLLHALLSLGRRLWKGLAVAVIAIWFVGGFSIILTASFVLAMLQSTMSSARSRAIGTDRAASRRSPASGRKGTRTQQRSRLRLTPYAGRNHVLPTRVIILALNVGHDRAGRPKSRRWRPVRGMLRLQHPPRRQRYRHSMGMPPPNVGVRSRASRRNRILRAVHLAGKPAPRRLDQRPILYALRTRFLSRVGAA